MKRIGILTFHKVDNYGAVLQTLALQEALTHAGNIGCVVDYYPVFMRESAAILQRNSLKAFVKSFLWVKKRFQKHLVFNQFRDKYYHVVGCNLKADSLALACNNVDMFALGSDQIWNPRITKGVDPVYYGRFGGKAQNAFSYAASIGANRLDDNEKESMAALTKTLKSVGVREVEVANLLGIKNYCVVCDPVLLHDRQFWVEKLKINTSDERPYIFLYALMGYKDTYDMTRKLAQKTGLPVIEIRNANRAEEEIHGETILYAASPEHFVSLIANATYVVTDSFHGTAFSMIFERNFFVIPNKEKGGRMISIMQRLGVEHRIIDTPDKITDYIIDMPIDMEYLREQREQFRKTSLRFLREAVMK